MKFPTKHEHINIFILYILFACFVIGLFVARLAAPHPSVILRQDFHEVLRSPPTSTQPLFDLSVFSNVPIEGKAYLVYDLENHAIIASRNETSVLPLASLTKVMTAVTAILHHPRETKIIIRKESLDGGLDLGLKNNQSWTLKELLKYTLVFSSNDGAQIIADSLGGRDVFVEQMNQDAKTLGLNLHFTSPAGLDLHGNVGGTGSALDVAKLISFARILVPDIFDATTHPRATVVASTGRISGVPNTNQETENLPGIEASKTGFTDLAGGNLAVVVDLTVGHPVAIIVLGSTREGRFRDVDTLYKALQKSVSVMADDQTKER
jgi:D-alanyl-D-alanine carboxypeptidase